MALGPVKRLRKELLSLEKAPDPDIQLSPQEDNIRLWTTFLLAHLGCKPSERLTWDPLCLKHLLSQAFIRGPSDTPFEGGIYEVKIEVGTEYPIRPPVMKFATRIFHPNIHFDTGEICLDILKKEWSPAWSLQAACRAVMALLSAAAADSPLNCDAGNMVRAGDMRAFNSLAKMYRIEYALTRLPS